ncbi:DMT family transporter [Actinomadura rifamycini]|uniref:DMT family transporter n=1 Tax=Actinomadura rifamycini TaxID=31962 RepID=UPI000A01E6BF|nr:DMT family transporter [Actinomadura rifamycini]
MSRRGWVLFALMCVLWGIPYLLIKVAVDEVSVAVVVFARTALGAAVLLPLAFRSGGFGAVRRHWRPLLAFTALEILGPWALLSDAEQQLTSSMTGLLIAAVPIVGVVLARGTGDAERLGPVRWAGLLVGLAGVAVLAAPHLEGGSAWAIGEIMLVVLGYSIAPMIALRRLQDVPSMQLSASSLGIAALVYAGPAAFTLPAEPPSGATVAALVALGLVCTALAFTVFFELIREVGASRGMVFTYVNPAVAVVAGVMFLDEPLTATIIASFVLILGGSVLATARRDPDPPDAPAPATPPPARTESPDPA